MPSTRLKSSDTDDGNHEMSTAPTTPDGSLTFSPVLQALSLDDGITIGNTTVNETSTHHLIENVCCVGAGYVGMSNFLYFC